MQLIQCFCDKCGNKTVHINRHFESKDIMDGLGAKILEINEAVYDLCDECNKKFEHSGLTIVPFMETPNEKLQFIEFDFKIGDEVTTSTGEVGFITGICTCDQCKKRGFYEPSVQVVIGSESIYITDTDKENEFCNFYRIGKHYFRNIDKNALLREIEYVNSEIEELQARQKMNNKRLNKVLELELENGIVEADIDKDEDD